MLWELLLVGVLAWAAGYATRRRGYATKPESGLPLLRSWLCGQCEWVGNSANRCPRCGSDCILSLARLLSDHRTTEPR